MNKKYLFWLIFGFISLIGIIAFIFNAYAPNNGISNYNATRTTQNISKKN